MPHQIAWILGEDELHAQKKPVFALAEKSVRVGWTFCDAFKNVRKRLRYPNRDYLFATRDYQSALEYMTQAREFAALAIERDDDEAWGHWVMGAYRLLCGETDHAVEAYHRALELNPNDADVLAEFGSCLSYVGQHEEAREAIEEASHQI